MIFQIFGTLYEDSRANNIRYDPVLSETLGKQVLVSQLTLSRFLTIWMTIHCGSSTVL